MKKLKSILKVVSRHRVAYGVGAAIAAIVIIASVASYVFMSTSQGDVHKRGVVTRDELKKKQSVAKTTQPIAETTVTPPVAAPQTTPAPAAQSKPQTQPKTAPVPKPAAQPAVIPLTVSSIFSWGGGVCSNGSMKLSLINETALYLPAGAAGGTVRWQVETMNNEGLRIGQTGIETIVPNEMRHVVTGLVPSDMASGFGAKIRLHVTSPNDVVSSWYTPTVYGSCSY